MKILQVKVVFVCLLLNPFMLFLPVANVSAERDIQVEIDNYVEAYLEEQRIPGAAIAIVHENNLFYSKAWGITGESGKK